jgi:hypothetical protein
MNINKHNYEAFFLDYHEGNLSPQQVADLLLFIEQHPELKEEFESFENFSLEDFSSYIFENKEELKKEITLQNKDEYFSRSVDETLTEMEANLLEQFLKQHPQYFPEFELFRKTKLFSEKGIVFENKDELKQITFQIRSAYDSREEMMIAASEGILTTEELSLFNQQLSVDPEMSESFSLYKKIKLQPELSVVFENKEILKRKDKKIIPFYYYISAAAAILLLFGMFIIFKNGDPDKQKLTNASPLPSLRNDSPKIIESQNNSLNIEPKELATTITPLKKKVDHEKTFVDTLNSSPENNFENISITNNRTEPEIKKEIQQEQLLSLSNKSESNSALALKADDNKEEGSLDFMSLGEIAASKIKEKTLDPEVYAMEKKNGSIKKFSGWDILQVVAKGVSKITGRKVEAKPTYNSEGEVTAYALGAGGFEISRGKKSN